MKRQIAVLLLLLLLIGAALVGTAAAWPASLADWEYRQLHNITGSGSWSDNLTNYPIHFICWNDDSGSGGNQFSSMLHSQADFDDLRFTTTGNFPIIFDSWDLGGITSTYGKFTEFDVIQKSGAIQHYIYYGNPDAESVSNIKSTFPLLGDDFGGTVVNTSTWTIVSNNTVTVSDGVLNMTSTGGGTPFLYSVNTFGINTSFGVTTRWSRNGNAYFGYYDQSTSNLFLQRSNTTKYEVWSRLSGAITSTGISTGYGDSQWNHWELWRKGEGEQVVYINSTQKADHATNIFTTNGAIRFYIPAGQWGYIDAAYVRPKVSPEPTHGTWYEEERQINPFAVDFSGSPLSGTSPLTVDFSDLSYTINSDLAVDCVIDAWQWSWGDATANGTTENPSHTYTGSGLFDVTLTVFNSTYSKSNTTVKTGYVNVGNATPTPTPTPTPTQTPIPCAVNTTVWINQTMYLKCDWNGNGACDLDDVTYLQDHISELNSTYEIPEYFSVNGAEYSSSVNFTNPYNATRNQSRTWYYECPCDGSGPGTSPPYLTSGPSISFADVKTIRPMAVVVYHSNGTYYGTWDTDASVIFLDPNQSYNLTFVPNVVDRLILDPQGTLQDAVAFVQNNPYGFLVIVILLALVIILVRRR